GAEASGHDHGCERQIGHVVASATQMAGAPGFEPGIAGPKPAALPLGYAPLRTEYKGAPAGPSAMPFGEEEHQRDDREQCDDRDRDGFHEAERERHAEEKKLRRRQDPAHVANHVGAARTARVPPEGD